MELEPGADPAAAARSLNILRTHYTASQRALFAATRANASKADHIPKSRDVKIVTVEQAAHEAGVSKAYVTVGRKVIREAAPELIEAVRAGRMTLSAAADAVNIAAGAAPRPRDRRLNRAIPKPPDEQFARAVQMADEGTRACLANAPRISRDGKVAAWINTLTETRTRITHVLKALEA